MTKWDKFMEWWDYDGRHYLARSIILLIMLGITIIVIYPVPFSWAVLLTRLGMLAGALVLTVVFLWALHNVD